ncbi:hypothetical protein KCMC57_up00740 [Kitasatospora sp. CMC57]|uniref:Uncharacterized protein n=1 Tax=Kitasatospora sp. CMC57 TaxID=3231513 RepID=A0AB33JNS2_9ACTN
MVAQLRPGLALELKELKIVDFTDRRSSDTGSELRLSIDYMSVTVPHVLLVSPDGVVLKCPRRADRISLSTNNKIDYVAVP